MRPLQNLFVVYEDLCKRVFAGVIKRKKQLESRMRAVSLPASKNFCRGLTMKVIFYTDTFMAGGAEAHILLLASSLKELSVKVILACPKDKALDEWCAKISKLQIKVVRLNVKHKHDPRHFFEMKNLLNREKPDFLHMHLWNPAAGRYAFFAGLSHRKTNGNLKIIFTEHDPFRLGFFKTCLKKYMLRRANMTICVSHSNERLMLEMYPFLRGKIMTIHNGIDIAKSKRQANLSEKLRNKMRFEVFGISNEVASNETFLILSVAALHERKGLKYLLEAFSEILKTKQNVLLAIIGDGPEENNLKKLSGELGMNDKTLFLGRRKKIPELMACADVFVLPSVKEAFGLVILEAMAAKVPVIASSVGGIPEIISHPKSGILVNPRDSQNLREAISMFVEKPILAKIIVTAALNDLTSFDRGIMAQKTKDAYLELMP